MERERFFPQESSPRKAIRERGLPTLSTSGTIFDAKSNNQRPPSWQDRINREWQERLPEFDLHARQALHNV